MWNFWDRCFSNFFGFRLPVSFHHCSIVIYHRPMRCAIALTKQHITIPRSYVTSFIYDPALGWKGEKKYTEQAVGSEFDATVLIGGVEEQAATRG
jgi:hypothetical protein